MALKTKIRVEGRPPKIIPYKVCEPQFCRSEKSAVLNIAAGPYRSAR
jgi:hypothetical protein